MKVVRYVFSITEESEAVLQAVFIERDDNPFQSLFWVNFVSECLRVPNCTECVVISTSDLSTDKEASIYERTKLGLTKTYKTVVADRSVREDVRYCVEAVENMTKSNKEGKSNYGRIIF